jgi:hypothetical protein
MASREASDERIPSCPMAIPSVTVIVVNSRGRAVGVLHAQLHRLRLTAQRDVAGRGLVPAGCDADEGLMDFLVPRPIA